MKQLAQRIGWTAIGLVGALSLPALANDSTGWVSTGGVQYLKKAGFADALHLQGGIVAWAKQLEPDMVMY